MDVALQLDLEVAVMHAVSSLVAVRTLESSHVPLLRCRPALPSVAFRAGEMIAGC